jgi:polar amino acid transport system substrate-binding protein
MKKFFLFLCVFFAIQFIFSNDLSKIDLNQSQLRKILQAKQLRISVSNDNEPLYIENSKQGFPGFEVDIALAYAEYLGVKLVRIVPKNNFEEHYKAIMDDEVDISMGNSANIERGKKMGFSDPYILTNTAALVRKSVLPPEPEGEIINMNPYTSLKDLQYQTGITMGVKSYTYNSQFIKTYFGNKFSIYTYITDALALNALLKNKINCYIADNLYIEAILVKNPSLKANYRALIEPVEQKEVSIGFKKYDVILMQDLNFFIRQMKRSHEIENLKNKYLKNNQWVVKRR